jgi:glycosyltransferase involved in cell wall biosynthesis
MRICHFCSTTLDSHYFEDLGGGLLSRGVHLLLCSLSEKQTPKWLEERGCGQRFVSLNAPSKHGYPSAVVALARLLRRERIQILQTHLFDAGVVGVLAAGLARTPITILTRHHTDEVRLIGSRFHVGLDRWMARTADRVVVFSHAVRNYMVSNEHLPAEKIDVIYQGFDFERFSATEQERQRIRAEFKFTSEFVIGCVARLFKIKGHIYLLTALRDLAKDIPQVRVLLLGNGNQTAVRDMIHDLGLEGRVVFAGHRKDVAACLRAVDIVVHPSLAEAFCQVLVECMSVGTPLVTTDVGGAAEVVTHGKTGILVPAASSEAIYKAVLELYRDPERRRTMAAAAQRSVHERFTIERMVAQQVNCYERLLGYKSCDNGR